MKWGTGRSAFRGAEVPLIPALHYQHDATMTQAFKKRCVTIGLVTSGDSIPAGDRPIASVCFTAVRISLVISKILQHT
ncbi:hypothetical protein [Arthrobacter sp. AQ5-05]|uniref:hypothetical protein n=1 Tax=Arthrobacter sp. AQ5-05 TaxID=2184581 RepID=UPI0015EB5591|nr:hypothetical protein [Arthrobacter sp. AQ5-05]